MLFKLRGQAQGKFIAPDWWWDFLLNAAFKAADGDEGRPKKHLQLGTVHLDTVICATDFSLDANIFIFIFNFNFYACAR